MRTFKVELDTAYADKAIKETGLLQGNQNFAFEFRLAERGEPITIDNMKKPKLIFNFENGVESFTVDESSPDYPVTVAGNVVKVAASKYLSMGYGRVKLMIKIDDYYTYSCIYYVDRNENFTAPPVAQSDAGDFALKDFNNVSNDVFRQKYKEAVKEPMSDADFLTQAKKNGLAENDFADVDLQKLYDKGIDSGLMSKDGSNFSPSDFDRELKANAAFRALQNADHPAISGKTDEEIKKLFYANRYEVQAAIDLSQPPYKDATTLYLAFQLTSDGQKITQILPLHSDGKIVNDNSWSDAGSSDPLKVQGDFKFLVDGNVNMEYQAQIFNETGTINNVEIWLAKVGPGPDMLTEVSSSKLSTTIEANRTKPKKVYSKSFSFSAKANETYRVLAKSNVADGFYLQSGTDGVPLFAASIVFDETNGRPAAMDKAPVIQVMEDGKPIAGKTIQIDSKTGAITIK